MEGMEALARRMLDLFLGRLILCAGEKLERHDISFWCLAYLSEVDYGGREEDVARRAAEMAREILAYQCAEERLGRTAAGNSENVAAVLLYNISQTGARNIRRHHAWRRRIRRGFRLCHLRQPHDAAELVADLRGSHLSEQHIGDMLGRRVNLDRTAQFVQEEYVALGEVIVDVREAGGHRSLGGTQGACRSLTDTQRSSTVSPGQCDP